MFPQSLIYIIVASFLFLLFPIYSIYFLIAAFTSSLNKKVPLTKAVLIHDYEIGFSKLF